MSNRLFASEEKKEKFFKFVETNLDTTEDKQLTKFLLWCFDNGFFNNVLDTEIQECYEYKELCLSLLKNNSKITIGVDFWKDFDFAYVGIDPSECFNKIKQCSVVAKLPISSKREEEKFYRLLDSLMDDKRPQTKEWRNGAGCWWYGEYAKFGM